ncbi:MAG: DUF4190 domain-containing protein [Ruminococcus sp.]|nr:DUF4190 domain-containing protein [Ruminococcus sp.]MCD7772534.1 DUF4190 domain-containing protein [Ruminococcus sp.]
MKFCKNCGAQIEDAAAFCPNCGTTVAEEPDVTASSEPQFNEYQPTQPAQPVQPDYQQYQQYQQPGVYPEGKLNGLAVAGFVVSLVSLFICGISSIVGLILSAIGLMQINKNVQQGIPQRGKGMAIAGLVIGIVGAALVLISIISCAAGTGLFYSMI